MRVIANIAMAAGLLTLAALLYVQVQAAQEGCQLAIDHFHVRQCGDHLRTFCWPVLGIVSVAILGCIYNLRGRRGYLVWAGLAFILFAAVSALGAFMLVMEAALGQAALA